MSVAIVTGGSRGIGAATAAVLAEQGWDIVIGYRSQDDAANRIVDACRRLGRHAAAVRGEIDNEADVLRLFEAAEGFGPLTALVNNAGVVAPAARVDQMDIARLQRMFAINTIGPFLCAREAVRRMSTKNGGGGGAIVNVSSAASRVGGAGQYVDYAASKGAIDTMTLGLAREVAGEGIRVNAVRPGVIRTDIHADAGNPDRADQVGPSIPMQRAGEPREIAEAIAWLCSASSSYTTGAVIDVTGGR